jgi:hypothetical protein
LVFWIIGCLALGFLDLVFLTRHWIGLVFLDVGFSKKNWIWFLIVGCWNFCWFLGFGG